MKLHVTGNAGAGKTTLAKSLGEMFSLPVSHLDQVVWQSGWVKTPVAERQTAENILVNRPRWVIDGVSSQIRVAADLTLFLDVPRSTCYWRCVKRNYKYLFRSRPELPQGCPEILILPKLISIIWRFPGLFRKQLLDEAKRDDLIVIRNDADLALAIKKIANRVKS